MPDSLIAVWKLGWWDCGAQTLVVENDIQK
jgi:hypothetical protein